ncbi:LppP/LprE family lipoprotein [Rhodococcoides fascians A21d2]|uniref:LppP/LprE family lipoprotein n=1 Tax=Rhodococcoides fascians TaxID=1828 RepID=UPI00056B1521|nr:LppP/LprE family lipoprotein [Rhodococcus fascians]QIH99960.1 LppP/LprE family lipoprotein [Rhodococcus fascians A21d2]
MKRLLLVTITALSLVACGNSHEPVTATATGAPTSNAQPQPVQPQDQPDATQPVAAGEDADPNGPVDSNTEELPENNSIPDATAPVTCLDVSSSSVAEAVNSLPLVFADSPWVATRMGDPCASFTWVEALPYGATVSSPTHLLFFHDAEYLGTATLEPYGFTSVAAQSADTITVNYRWPLAGDANANPTGGPVTIDYRWDGTQVTMIGTLPPEVSG